MITRNTKLDSLVLSSMYSRRATPPAGCPKEKRAAYFARKGILEPWPYHDDHTFELMARVNAIWEKWQQMQGDNRPLVRSTAGAHRDFDLNLDGMAHYGMLPDFLQDLRNSGLTTEDLAPLFRSALQPRYLPHTAGLLTFPLGDLRRDASQSQTVETVVQV